MKAERDLVKVAIFTEQYKLVGNVHVVPGGRISDFLASKISSNFIPVTDVKVYSTKDAKLVMEVKFLTVNTDSIILFYPVDKSESIREF